MKRKDIYDVEEYKRVLLKAQKKGLDLLMGESNYSCEENLEKVVEVGYAVVIDRAGLQFTVDDKGNIYLGKICDGPYYYYHTWHKYSLEEAEKIIDNYREEKFSEKVKFYGFVRQYEDEPEYIVDAQMQCLELFEKLHDIQYEMIFGCRGGVRESQEECMSLEDELNIPEIDNLTYSCEKFFREMAEKENYATVVLCITDYDRLEGDKWVWGENTNITTVVPSSHSYSKDAIVNYKVYTPGLSENINSDEYLPYPPEEYENDIAYIQSMSITKCPF